MKKALIINAHQEYPFAKGDLNREIAKRIGEHLQSVGYEIKITTMKDAWDANEEVDKPHYWTFFEKRRVSSILEFTTTPRYAHPTATQIYDSLP